MRQLTRTNVREDYESDEVFANFRLIKTTGITPGLLYRSSSPVNNELGRAAYADKLAQAAGVKTIINFADSDEEVAGYMAAEDYNSPYYKSLYDSGKVINLNMGVDIAGADFGEKLAQGLRFLINNEGPYLIHCTEGKDRAGFASALLECLMGASLDEVVADYMTTYENYYKIEKGSEQYNKIAESNIIASVTTVLCGLEKGSDISECDLALAAENYLLKAGMTSNEIAALKSKLSAEITVPDLPPVEEPVTEEPVVEETPVSEVTYVVVAGDCLWNIAKTYLGNGARYMEIYNLNKDKISNPDLIYVGQILILPSE
jgi:protein tyrosine/serine phosphatase